MTVLESVKRLHQIQHNLLSLNQQLDLINLEGAHMAVSPAVQTILDAVDAATNAIAARIAALVAGAGLSADDKAAFQTEIDKLTALGKSDVIPVP